MQPMWKRHAATPNRAARGRVHLRRRSLLVAAFGLALAACSDVGASSEPVAADGSLPPAWREVHSTRFEAALDARLPRGASVELDASTLAELTDALDESPAVATRAAIWLARSGDARVPDVLLDRLEARVPAPERADDAGDATAAAALARLPLTQVQVGRLVDLAVGGAAHPDLEVRAECAIAALGHGREDGLALLLRILRIDTPSESRDGPLTDSATTAWVRGRADQALCELLGVPVAVRTDLPLAEREAHADRLEALVGERRQ